MPVVWHIETHDTLPSTQDTLKERARQGKPEGTVVQAITQTAGRGRHGRNWVSEKGNLYISLLLKPAGEARFIGQMGLLTGVALAETILKYLENPDVLTLKWPNDILLEGMKCAGILVETQLTPKNTLSWVGIGIGVNLVTAPAGTGRSLDKYAAKEFSMIAFRTTLLSNIDKYYALWSKEGFEKIKEKWLEYAHKKGTRVKVKLAGRTEEGTFQGIDDDGNLLLTDSHLNLKKITAGEVYL